MVTKKRRYRIIRTFFNERPTVWIGKNGVSDEVIHEINKQLKINEVIKIKILKSVLETTTMKMITAQVIQNTNSELIEARGHNLILFREKPKRS